jgi:hypothetical protein
MTTADTPPRKPRAALLLAHALDDVTLARWRDWRAGWAATHDARLVLTAPHLAAARALGLDEVVLVDPAEIFRPEHRPKSASGKIVPGNVDLVLLALRRRFPGWQFIVTGEYDVFLPTGFAAMRAADAASDADLIANQLRPQAEDPDWLHWGRIRPGPGDDEAALWAMLFPLARWSGRLLDALDAAYRHGWRGHYEATVPSIAAARGLPRETWNDAAARAGVPPITAPESFDWRRMRPVAAHLAHHPVKTQDAARDIARALGLPPPQEVPPW